VAGSRHASTAVVGLVVLIGGGSTALAETVRFPSADRAIGANSRFSVHPAEIVVYPGACHNFDQVGDARAHRDAARPVGQHKGTLPH
jgi:hypothetical protein